MNALGNNRSRGHRPWCAPSPLGFGGFRQARGVPPMQGPGPQWPLRRVELAGARPQFALRYVCAGRFQADSPMRC